MDDKKEVTYLENIRKYVDDNLKKGFSVEVIRQKLESSNVPSDIIDKALGPASPTPAVPPLPTLQSASAPEKKPGFKLNIKWQFIAIPTAIVLVIALIVIFTQSASSSELLTLDDFPACQNENSSIDAYHCYLGETENLGGARVCGWYFAGYEEEREEYLEKMSEAEIILSIDGREASSLWDGTDTDAYYSFFGEKEIGDIATIETNLGTYEYHVNIGPEGGAYIYINFGKAYCK